MHLSVIESPLQLFGTSDLTHLLVGCFKFCYNSTVYSGVIIGELASVLNTSFKGNCTNRQIIKKRGVRPVDICTLVLYARDTFCKCLSHLKDAHSQLSPACLSVCD